MLRRTLIATAGAAALAACAPTDGGGDIVDIAAADADFSTLVTAVTAAGLAETLKGPGPFTVFAPTDAAFAALPDGTVEGLLEPAARGRLTEVLTYHVVPGYFPAETLVGKRGALDTVAGGSLRVDGTGGGVTVNGATVVTPDVMASNGVIHVIDGVLLP